MEPDALFFRAVTTASHLLDAASLSRAEDRRVAFVAHMAGTFHVSLRETPVTTEPKQTAIKQIDVVSQKGRTP